MRKDLGTLESHLGSRFVVHRVEGGSGTRERCEEVYGGCTPVPLSDGRAREGARLTLFRMDKAIWGQNTAYASFLRKKLWCSS